MVTDYPREVPLVLKTAVSIICIGDALETTALRAILERFNYRVEVHWVGSRKEVLAILCGEIPTFPIVILSCHGEGNGTMVVPNEPVISLQEADILLPDRLVLNLGCGTGTAANAARFLSGGCRTYIAPTREEVESTAALLFAIHLFYDLSMHQPLDQAISHAQAFDAECGQFACWSQDACPINAR